MGAPSDQAAHNAAAFLTTAQADGATDATPILDTVGYGMTFGDLRALLAAVPRKIGPTAGTDYRAQAHQWAGQGREAMVDAIALFLHHNESLHMHEDVGAACCAYCWLRAGKAILALTQAGLMEGGS